MFLLALASYIQRVPVVASGIQTSARMNVAIGKQ